MEKWLQFAALLAIAGLGTASAFLPIEGVDHLLLFTALIAVFWASDARYWKRT